MKLTEEEEVNHHQDGGRFYLLEDIGEYHLKEDYLEVESLQFLEEEEFHQEVHPHQGMQILR